MLHKVAIAKTTILKIEWCKVSFQKDGVLEILDSSVSNNKWLSQLRYTATFTVLELIPYIIVDHILKKYFH